MRVSVAVSLGVVTTNMAFKPSLDYSKPCYKETEPQAFFIIDKRTGDRRLTMCLPQTLNTALYEIIALFTDKTYVIKEHIYKYKQKKEIKKVIASPQHINRISDGYTL